MHVVKWLILVAAIVCDLWTRVNVDLFLVNQLLFQARKVFEILHCIVVRALNFEIDAIILRLVDISLEHITKVHLDI